MFNKELLHQKMVADIVGHPVSAFYYKLKFYSPVKFGGHFERNVKPYYVENNFIMLFADVLRISILSQDIVPA